MQIFSKRFIEKNTEPYLMSSLEYINTQYSISNHCVEIKLKTNTKNIYQGFYNYYYYYYAPLYGSKNNKICCGYTDGPYAMTKMELFEPDNKKHIIKYNDDMHRVYVDGELKGTMTNIRLKPSSYPSQLYIFAYTVNYSTTEFNPSSIEFSGPYNLYYVKIYDNITNELVRHYVPYLDGNGIACMHELITDTYLYGNNGSANIKYGED